MADPLPETGSFGFIEALKKLQPGVAVLLLVNELELPAVIKCIRVAITDVLAPDGDWALVLQRVNAILDPERRSPSIEVTAAQLAEAEAILSGTGGAVTDARASGTGSGGGANDWRAELVRLARQRTELAEVRSEREIVAAAQAAVDEKARAVAEARGALAKERSALAAERAQGRPKGEVQRLKTAEALSNERHAIENKRSDLRAEEVRMREMAAQVRQGQVRLDIDRRRFHEDMDLLREQETNLRAYEQRLRVMGAEAEAARVKGAAPHASGAPFGNDAALETAWTRLDRAMDLLQAERRSFTGERLVLKEEMARLKKKEDVLRQREQSLEAREAKLAEPPVNLSVELPPPHTSFTRAPFKAARAIFAGGKK